MTDADKSRASLWNLGAEARQIEIKYPEIPATNNTTYVLDDYVRTARHLIKVIIHCDGGTCNITFNSGALPIGGLTNLSCSTTVTKVTATGLGVAFAEGEDLTFTVSSAVDLQIPHVTVIMQVDLPV